VLHAHEHIFTTGTSLSTLQRLVHHLHMFMPQGRELHLYLLDFKN
jgi:hypothetical protein